jgi:hypothetical protein
VLGRARRDPQKLAHLFVVSPQQEQLEHLPLAFREARVAADTLASRAQQ